MRSDKIKDNLEDKKIQNILTIFRKKGRFGEIMGMKIDFHKECKASIAQRQLEWCQYFQMYQLEETTSRLMLVDKRIHQALLPNTTPHPLKDEDVLQYRSYLYTKNPSEHSVVLFKGNIYVKFPIDCGVLKTSTGDIKTGKVTLNFENIYFATCWDCRTYSCMRPDYVRTADSDDTIRLLAAYAQPGALSGQIISKADWPSTPHDDLEACKYICLDTANARAHFVQRMTPFIEHSVHSITEQKQAHMFTLPDIFRNDNIDPVQMPSIPKVDDWNDVKFKDDLQKMIDDDNKDAQCKLWNKLRNSSRYIATQHIPDPKDAKNIIVQQVLDTGDPSFKDPFREIIATLRRRILPKTNEDT